jgi:hypothetical protein
MSSANRYLYVKLNNYNYSDDYLDAVVGFLKNGVFPADMTRAHQNTLKKRYSADFIVKGTNTLFYKPLNLEIVRPAEREAKLKLLYDDPKIGIGAGIRSFYNKVLQQYLGIRRTDVAEFLQKQTPYQLTKKERRPTNKPVIGEYPNHRWEADLIDVSNYSGHNARKKYILTVIDCFSKYVFAAPLVTKTAKSITRELERIAANQSGGIYPVILQTDNGGEFLGDMKPWCESKNIRQVFSRTHTPQTNGLVENFNLYLRQMIREGFVRTNTLNWTRHLNDYLYNRNHTKHTATKYTPAEVWTATREPIVKGGRVLPATLGDKPLTQNQKQNNVKKRTITRARKELDRYEDEKFVIGDKVRIKLAAIDTKVRKEIKAGNEKLLPIKYTPDVFDVVKVFNPKANTLQKPQYETTHSRKRFWGSELRKVDSDAVDVNVNYKKLNGLR